MKVNIPYMEHMGNGVLMVMYAEYFGIFFDFRMI